jgi:hypothetical protein
MEADGFVPGVVLCDYALAGLADQDGMQATAASLGAVVEAVRTHCGEPIPACVFGGPADAGLREQWQEQGVVVLDKPVRPAKLRAWLRRLKSRA